MITNLSLVEPGDVVTEELITKLFIVEEAQVKWLQDELANLVVAVTSHTTRFCKLLQKNSSLLTSRVLENLRNAATIAAANPEIISRHIVAMEEAMVVATTNHEDMVGLLQHM